MKNCPSCGSEIRKDASFCPQCGENIAVDSKPYIQDLPNTRPKRERHSFLGFTFGFLLVLVGGYFINKYLINNRSNYNSNEIISEVTGTYKDKNGIITGIKGNDIKVSAWNMGIEGRSSGDELTFNLSLVGRYEFEGDGNLRGVDISYQVTYAPDTRRLIFKRENSPLNWYIEKE